MFELFGRDAIGDADICAELMFFLSFVLLQVFFDTIDDGLVEVLWLFERVFMMLVALLQDEVLSFFVTDVFEVGFAVFALNS